MRCKEHDKVMPHYRCLEAAAYLDGFAAGIRAEQHANRKCTPGKGVHEDCKSKTTKE